MTEVQILKNYVRPIFADIAAAEKEVRELENMDQEHRDNWRLEVISKELFKMQRLFNEINDDLKIISRVMEQMQPLLIAAKQGVVQGSADSVQELLKEIDYMYDQLFSVFGQVFGALSELSDVRTRIDKLAEKYARYIDHHLKLLETTINQEKAIFRHIKQELNKLKGLDKKVTFEVKSSEGAYKKEERSRKKIMIEAKDADEMIEHVAALLVDGGPIRNMEEYTTHYRKAVRDVATKVEELLSKMEKIPEQTKGMKRKEKKYFLAEKYEEIDEALMLISLLFDELKHGKKILYGLKGEFKDIVDRLKDFDFSIGEHLTRMMREQKEMYESMDKQLARLGQGKTGAEKGKLDSIRERIRRKRKQLKDLNF